MSIAEYKIIYMLPSSMEEKLVEEFSQKLDKHINSLGGSVQNVEVNKSYMVKTSTNKGSRGVHLVVTKAELATDKVTEIDRYFKLAQGVVLNHLILRPEEEVKIAATAEELTK